MKFIIFLALCICILSMAGCIQNQNLAAFLKIKHVDFWRVGQDQNITYSVGKCYVMIQNLNYDFHEISNSVEFFTTKNAEGNKIRFNMCNDVPTDCTTTGGLVVDNDKCIVHSGFNGYKDKKFTIASKYIHLLN